MSNGEANFLDELLLSYTQDSKICKAFANGSPDHIKLTKAWF